MALTNEKSTPVPATQALVACRVCLCLATNGKMYCFETAELKLEFFNITSLQVSPGDGLPQHICHICRGLLRKATEFRNKCHSTHKLLSSHPVTLEFIQNIHILHCQSLQNTDVVSASFDSNPVGLQSDIESDSENHFNNDEEDSDRDFLNSPDDADSKLATENNLNGNDGSDDDLTIMVDENAKNSVPIVETKLLIQNTHGQSLQNTDIVSVPFDSNSVDLQLGAEGDTQNDLNKEEKEENDKYFQSDVKNDIQNHFNKEDLESDLLNSHEDTDFEWATDNNLNDNDQSNNDFITELDDEFNSMVDKVGDETEDCIPFGEIKSEETEADTMDMQSNDTTVEYDKMLHEYMQVKYVSKTLIPDSLKLGCSKRKLYNYMRAKYNYKDKDEEKEKKRNISLKNTIFLHAKKYNFKVEYFSNKDEQIENLRARMDTHKYKQSKFKCTDCYIGFQNEHKYKKHRTRHDSATHGHYKCEVCKLRYHDNRTLLNHTRYHKCKFICNQCGMPFLPVSQAKLQEHFKSHNGGSKYKCEYCPHVVSKKATLLHHVYRNHGSVPCGICHFMMLPNGVHRHMIRQHDKTFTCSSCFKVFNDYAAIAKHIHTSPNGVCGADAWPCTKCGENFNMESDLREHIDKCRRRLTPQQREEARGWGARRNKGRAGQNDLPRDKKMKCRNTPAGIVCEWCAKISRSISHYNIHVRTHTGERPFACPECPKAFRVKQHLQNHLRVHKNKPSDAGRKERRTFTCSSCNKVFNDYAAIATHIHTSPNGVCGADAWPCTKCGENFNTESDLRGHISECCRKIIKESGRKKTTRQHMVVHTGERAHQCPQCEKAYFSKTALRMHHKIVHENLRPHECTICSKKFPRAYNLKLHLNTVHVKELPHDIQRKIKEKQETQKNIICEWCAKKFSNRSGYRRHVMTHTDERPHACPECPKAFRTKKDLRIHMPVHTGERAHQCSQCEKAFHSSSALRSHRRTHGTQNIMSCECCAKVFSNPSNYRCHVKIHTAERPHACPECPKAFSCKSHLKVHMAVHTGERAHQCPQCEKAYTTRSTLRLHVQMVHEKLRPHECTICSKKFPRAQNLRLHMNAIHKNEPSHDSERKKNVKSHTDERPHTCPECPKAFRNKSNLTQHMTVHTGDRRHQCPQCGKVYTSSASLKVHREFVHENLRPHECTICSKKFSLPNNLKVHLKTIHMYEPPRDSEKLKKEKKVGKGVKKVGSEVKKVGKGVKKLGRDVKKVGRGVRK